MKWYIHPSRHLDGDELPPELVLTNGDGSVSQVYVPYNESDASAVLQAVDQLRRDLSGYHGQLKAHNDLQRHCDNQRKRITELEGLYAKAKVENARLRSCLSDDAENAKLIMGENAKLRELVEKMARALGVGSDWCNRDCGEEFGCWGDENGVTGRCAIVDTMEELGWPVVEVDE